MNDPASANYYPSGPQSAPINYWHLWAPIFQKLGIDPTQIPNFAPPAAPEGEGLPAWQRNNAIYEASTGGQPLGLSDAGSFAQPDPQQIEMQRRRMMGLLAQFGTGT